MSRRIYRYSMRLCASTRVPLPVARRIAALVYPLGAWLDQREGIPLALLKTEQGRTEYGRRMRFEGLNPPRGWGAFKLEDGSFHLQRLS